MIGQLLVAVAVVELMDIVMQIMELVAVVLEIIKLEVAQQYPQDLGLLL